MTLKNWIANVGWPKAEEVLGTYRKSLIEHLNGKKPVSHVTVRKWKKSLAEAGFPDIDLGSGVIAPAEEPEPTEEQPAEQPAPEPKPQVKRAPAAKRAATKAKPDADKEPEIEPEPVKVPVEDLPAEVAFTGPEWKRQVEWSGKKLFVGFPCYKHTNPVTAWTLLAISQDLGADKVYFDMEIGDAMIYHARNKLAKRFLEHGAEWLLFLDDDIIAPIGRAGFFRYYAKLPDSFPEEVAGRHVVHRLLGHGKSIIGGTYFGRQKTGWPMFHGGLSNREDHHAARDMVDGIRPTDWVATGCLLVNRQVFLDIQKKFPELAPHAGYERDQATPRFQNRQNGQFVSAEEAAKLSTESVQVTYETRKVKVPPRSEWDFFLPDGSGGEDVSFCRRAREAGHQVWVDTGLQCGHVGYCVYHAKNTDNGVDRTI